MCIHMFSDRVLEEGRQLDADRKAWQAQATRSFQNKRARSVSRARAKTLSAAAHAHANPSTRPQPQDGATAAADRTRMAGLRSLFEPTHPLGPSPGYLPSIKSAITYTPLNVCLAFIPVSWALHYSHQSDTLTFICSSLAIIPLAAQLTLATEQISLRTSQAVGGLVNATFGNIVELIIGGIALSRVSTHAAAASRSSATPELTLASQ